MIKSVCFLSVERPFEPLAASGLIAFACAATLGFALTMQFAFNHPPCELCLWQRVPYIVAGCFATLSVALHLVARGGKARAVSFLLGACACLFLIGACVAMYHSGIERHWWQGATSCSLPPLRGEGASALLATPVARCDEIGWSIAGVTMANLNVPFSLALSAFSWLAARRSREKARHG